MIKADVDPDMWMPIYHVGTRLSSALPPDERPCREVAAYLWRFIEREDDQDLLQHILKIDGTHPEKHELALCGSCGKRYGIVDVGNAVRALFREKYGDREPPADDYAAVVKEHILRNIGQEVVGPE